MLIRVTFSLISLFSLAFSHIVIGIHPIADKESVKKGIKPLAKFLEEKINQKVEIFVGDTYKEGEDKLIKGDIDLLIISPYGMYKMIKKYHRYIMSIAKLKLNGKSKYRGVIITRKNSDIRELRDIQGKSFVFGDPSSTFAYAVPKNMLKIAGVKPKKIYNVETQEQIVSAVAFGKVDAGGVKESFAKNNLDRVKIIKYSKYLPTYVIAVNLKKVKRKTITDIKKALLRFKGSMDMQPFGIVNGFLKTSNYEYRNLFNK